MLTYNQFYVIQSYEFYVLEERNVFLSLYETEIRYNRGNNYINIKILYLVLFRVNDNSDLKKNTAR